MKYPYTIPLLLYGAACFLPVIEGGNILGIHALTMGWMGMFWEFPVMFLWLANFTFFTSMILSDDKRIQKIIFSSITLLFGLTFFWIDRTSIFESDTDPVLPGIGYYFWMSAFLYLFFSLIQKRQFA